MNATNLIFRAHSVGDLMGAKGLGVTGQKRAIHQYIEATTGRTKEIKSKYLDKGIAMESDALKVVSDALQIQLEKNQVRMTNEYLTGECDAISSDFIVDVKCSWDLFTFEESKAEQDKNYYWQAQSYMNLYDREKYVLAYVLLDAPDSIILNELDRASYKYGGDLPDLVGYQIIKNMIFDLDNFNRFVSTQTVLSTWSDSALYHINSFVHIPIKKRLNLVRFERNEADITKMYQRIQDARNWLKSVGYE